MNPKQIVEVMKIGYKDKVEQIINQLPKGTHISKGFVITPTEQEKKEFRKAMQESGITEETLYNKQEKK